MKRECVSSSSEKSLVLPIGTNNCLYATVQLSRQPFESSIDADTTINSTLMDFPFAFY